MHCIGIDLERQNSLVSYWDETEGKVKLIPNEFGDTLTPSAQWIPERSREVLVGKAAKEMLINEPDRAFREFKRDMGTKTKYRVDRKKVICRKNLFLCTAPVKTGRGKLISGNR